MKRLRQKKSLHTYYNPTEIWWPHPSALDDLIVEDAEDGFTLSAPSNTECAEWLAYFAATPERQEVFNREFQKALLTHLDYLKERNGKDEVQPNEQAGS